MSDWLNYACAVPCCVQTERIMCLMDAQRRTNKQGKRMVEVSDRVWAVMMYFRGEAGLILFLIVMI